MTESPAPTSATDSSTVPVPAHRNRAPALGAKTAGGFAWLIGQSLGVKLVGIISQVVLSWFLTREDFGAVAWAFTVATFANLVQEAGIAQILVHRQSRFRLWCTPAFWMSMTLGVVAAAVMIAAAPVVAHLAHDPRLIGLVFVLAIKSPVAAFGVPSGALLQNQMRFRFIAVLGLISAVLTNALTVLFAWLKFGGYSIVLPLLIVTIIRTAAMWIAARPPIRFDLQLRRWRYLAGESTLLFAALGLFTFTSFGDYLILGLFQPTQVVGDYFWAYGLSLQTTALLTVNVGSVLFPALSKLQKEPDRQRQAFLRAGSAMELIGVPLCLLQAAVARPVVELFFDPKWLGAVPLLQILSVGMAMQLLNGPAVNLMQAQGRFRTLFRFAVGCAAYFTLLVLFGAKFGSSLGVSLAVCLYTTTIGLICPYVAIGSIGGRWSEIVDTILKPFAIAVPCVALGYYAGEWLTSGPIGKLLVVCTISGVGYLSLLAYLRLEGWLELLARVRAFRSGPPSETVEG